MNKRHDAAVAHWRLRNVEPLDGGCVGLVSGAELDGAEVVLKVSPRGHPDDFQLAGEGDALAFWEPTGAVALRLGSRDDGFTLLLERLVPGTALDETGARVGRNGSKCSAAWRRGCMPAARPAGAFISMRDFSHDWRTALATEPESLRELERLVAPTEDGRPRPRATCTAATRSSTTGDRRIIDPKGVCGDRHADVWALLEPDAPPLPSDAASGTAWAWVRRYAGAADMEPEHAGAWVRVRARAEAAWVTDAAWAARLRALAAALT